MSQKIRLRATGVAALVLCLTTSVAMGQQKAKKLSAAGARAVHAWYLLPPEAKDGVVEFYSEVIVRKTTTASYFQVCGFNGGYFGIQQLGDNSHVGIFSCWDANQKKDPKLAAKGDQVQHKFIGEGVRDKRFTHEGTGGHTDFDYPWLPDRPYRFYVRATASDGKTAYDAWIGSEELKPAGQNEGGWRHVATLVVPDGGKRLTGLYGFVEDFARTPASRKDTRAAAFGNAWVKASSDGAWLPVTSFRFTASGGKDDQRQDIDAEIIGDRIQIQTGGNTRNTTPLGSTLKLPVDKVPKVPPEVPPPAGTADRQ